MNGETITVSLTDVVLKIEEMRKDLERITIVLNSMKQQHGDIEGEIQSDAACSQTNPWNSPD